MPKKAKQTKKALEKDILKSIAPISGARAGMTKPVRGYTPDVAIARSTKSYVSALHAPWDPTTVGATVPTAPSLPSTPFRRSVKSIIMKVAKGGVAAVFANPYAALISGYNAWRVGPGGVVADIGSRDPLCYTAGTEGAGIDGVLNTAAPIYFKGDPDSRALSGTITSDQMTGLPPTMEQVASGAAEVRLVAAGLRARRVGVKSTGAGLMTGLIEPNHKSVQQDPLTSVARTFADVQNFQTAQTADADAREYLNVCFVPRTEHELAYAVGVATNDLVNEDADNQPNVAGAPILARRITKSGIVSDDGLIRESTMLGIVISGACDGETAGEPADTYEVEFWVDGEYIGQVADARGFSRTAIADPVGIDAALTVVEANRLSGVISRGNEHINKANAFLGGIADVVAGGTHVVAGAANTVRNIADATASVRDLVRAKKLNGPSLHMALSKLSRPLVQNDVGDLVPLLIDTAESVGGLLLG